ncbi:MAG TPA: hypothetical protein VGK48_12890 [Terriglobia bacterium]|jgi:hypothetical protein
MANAFERQPSRLLLGEIRRRWEQLSNSEIEQCTVDESKLTDLLQARYGYAKRRAEKEVELFFAEFYDRLRMAA